jgi:hypothetical protein
MRTQQRRSGSALLKGLGSAIVVALAAALIDQAGAILFHHLPALRAQNAPQLAIPAKLVPQANGQVAVPVQFDPAGSQTTSVLFSIDVDQGCLLFDPADSNRDGIPDAVTFFTPASFVRSFSYDALDGDGEIDVILADYSPPYALLSSSTLVSIQFSVICRPVEGTVREVAVPFSTAPGASFSMPSGSALNGVTAGGSVWIDINQLYPTPVPTATSTPTPTAPPPTPTTTPVSCRVTTPTATPAPPTDPRQDSDGDGVTDLAEGWSDWDHDKIPNYLDPDDDGDGVLSRIEPFGDPDYDGVPNFLDIDANGNGIPDAAEVGPDPLHPADRDGDGIWDFIFVPRTFLHLIATDGT